MPIGHLFNLPRTPSSDSFSSLPASCTGEQLRLPLSAVTFPLYLTINEHHILTRLLHMSLWLLLLGRLAVRLRLQIASPCMYIRAAHARARLVLSSSSAAPEFVAAAESGAPPVAYVPRHYTHFIFFRP